MDKWEESFLRELVELDTNSDEKKNYSECAEVVKKHCEEAGLVVEVFDSNHDGVPQPNIVATLDAGARKTALLCTHYDVVPAGDIEAWKRPPFKFAIEKGKAFGRGVSDNKGNIVACVSAAKELIKKGTSKINWKILISPNEEIGGAWGIDYLINDKPKIRGDFGIVVDSGPEYVSIGASGIVSGTITVHGSQGHAGYPFAYANAIHLSIPLLTVMLDYVDVRRKVESALLAPPGTPHQNLWGRFSMTMFESGSKSNVIPGKAEITFDCRLVPEEDPEEVKKSIEEFLGKEALVVNPPVESNWITAQVSCRRRKNSVITISRFRSAKNLEIIPKIASYVKDCEFVVIGIADEESEQCLKELFEEIGRLGVQQRVRVFRNRAHGFTLSALSTAKIFLHTQRTEAFGMSIVESMAAGCIPVVPRTGGPWIDILDSQEGQYGFSYRNPPEAAAKINLLLEDESLRSKVSIRATERSVAFDSSSFEKKLLKIAEAIFSRNKRFP